MFSSKTNGLRHFLMAGIFAAAAGLTITAANTPAQAQYYPPMYPPAQLPAYGNQYYSNQPYYNAYEARRAFWHWRHEYWRWYHENYR